MKSLDVKFPKDSNFRNIPAIFKHPYTLYSQTSIYLLSWNSRYFRKTIIVFFKGAVPSA